jgi:hypothetical protein
VPSRNISSDNHRRSGGDTNVKREPELSDGIVPAAQLGEQHVVGSPQGESVSSKAAISSSAPEPSETAGGTLLADDSGGQSGSLEATSSGASVATKKKRIAGASDFKSSLAPSSSFAVKIYERRKDKEQTGEYDKPVRDEYQDVVDAAQRSKQQQQDKSSISRTSGGPSTSPVHAIQPLSTKLATTSPVPASGEATPPPALFMPSKPNFVPVTRNSPTNQSFVSASFTNSILEDGGEYTSCVLTHYQEPGLVSRTESSGAPQDPPAPEEEYDDFLDDMAEEDMGANPLTTKRGAGASVRKSGRQSQKPSRSHH